VIQQLRATTSKERLALPFPPLFEPYFMRVLLRDLKSTRMLAFLQHISRSFSRNFITFSMIA
jgi:hypothetical protein